MKCNLCEFETKASPKSQKLLNHMRDGHKDIYDLHKDNPEATVGFRVEFLHMNVLKEDEVHNKGSMILGEICETTTTESEVLETSTTEPEESDVINMQYVMLDTKRKHRRTSGTAGSEARRRSWIWKYFDRLSNIVYRCNICDVVLSTKGSNTNNLNRHMRSKHPDTFKTEKFGQAMKDDSYMEMSSEADTPYAIKTEEIYASNERDSQKMRRSWVWSYFDYVTTTQAQCKLCQRQINHGGNATGNMNRHLKMIHHKTAMEGDISWIWKVFEKEVGYYTCKICQHRLSKNNSDTDIIDITNHLKKEHGVISGDQIITGSECDLEEN